VALLQISKFTFNRTSFGIEIFSAGLAAHRQNILLIVPVLELKLKRYDFKEIQKKAFNRTSFGIEIWEMALMNLLRRLLIVPVLELKSCFV